MSDDGKNKNSEERMRSLPGLSIRKRLARRVSTVVPEVVEKFVLAKRFFADIERMQFEAFSNRYDLYEFTNRTYYHGRALQFLELGVFEGESIERWATINSDPESRFHGFDSFEGLPEDWGGTPKGHFDLGGNIPRTGDARISFHKGWFQDTLPGFVASMRSTPPLLIHIDCDLYSSTLYCLSQLQGVFDSGVIVIFDEFGSVLHEYRAVKDFCSAYCRRWTIVGATSDMWTAAIRFEPQEP